MVQGFRRVERGAAERFCATRHGGLSAVIQPFGLAISERVANDLK